MNSRRTDSRLEPYVSRLREERIESTFLDSWTFQDLSILAMKAGRKADWVFNSGSAS